MTEILQFSDKGFPDGPGGHDVISTHIVKEYICEVQMKITTAVYCCFLDNFVLGFSVS